VNDLPARILARIVSLRAPILVVYALLVPLAAVRAGRIPSEGGLDRLIVPSDPDYATTRAFQRIFPDKPVTKKPAETRMGKGKGNPEFWVAVVKPGRIMYEMEGVDEATAKEGFRLAAQKIGIKTKFVTRVRAL